MKWEGWRGYNSPDMYQRLCIDAGSNPTTEIIETNCRELLVWWRKKLPLKSQPSNPVAQLLRSGLDDAPGLITEAKSCLLDPVKRAKIDAALHETLVKKTIEDFQKLIAFSLTGQKITEQEEQKLYSAGRNLGLSDDAMLPLVEAEIQRTGTKRVKTEAVAPVSVVAPSTPVRETAPASSGSPEDEFRKILRMSRLNVGDDEMTDDQRDAMCNLGESLGLTGGEAEDLIDEYLENILATPSAPAKQVAKPAPPVSKPHAAAPTAAKALPAATVQTVVKDQSVNVSPMAKAAERQKYVGFTNSVAMPFLLVPSGRITMGSNGTDANVNEQPLTVVTLSCFYMARYPVTNQQYECFDPSHKAKRAPWAGDSHPVIYVTALEAEAFCAWLSAKEKKIYRLPTEPEWEYAARGEDGRTFPWGEGLRTGDRANFADKCSRFAWKDTSVDDGFAETSPVGSFVRGASAYGIEDMAGNVFEWCGGWMEPYKGKPIINPRGPQMGINRVYRGGSWRSRVTSLRTTARGFNLPTYQSDEVGFRILCECSDIVT